MGGAGDGDGVVGLDNEGRWPGLDCDLLFRGAGDSRGGYFKGGNPGARGDDELIGNPAPAAAVGGATGAATETAGAADSRNGNFGAASLARGGGDVGEREPGGSGASAVKRARAALAGL